MTRLSEVKAVAGSVAPNQDARVLRSKIKLQQANRAISKKVVITSKKPETPSYGVCVTDINSWRRKVNSRPVVITRHKVAA